MTLQFLRGGSPDVVLVAPASSVVTFTHPRPGQKVVVKHIGVLYGGLQSFPLVSARFSREDLNLRVGETVMVGQTSVAGFNVDMEWPESTQDVILTVVAKVNASGTVRVVVAYDVEGSE